MEKQIIQEDQTLLSQTLFDIMQQGFAVVAGLELYEFRYCLENIVPTNGWSSVEMVDCAQIEHRINQRSYFENIPMSPRLNGEIIFTPEVKDLTQMLMAGLVAGNYGVDWVKKHFYFDVRGFFFLPRTHYYTGKVMAQFGGVPFKVFERKQKNLETQQEIGYKDFMAANSEIDSCFFDTVKKLIDFRGIPAVIGIAGPTAAGKTEIAARLIDLFAGTGRSVTTIEMDNFLLDRDYREAHGFDSLGRDALHLKLLLECLQKICGGEPILTPRYDFISGQSSHDLEGRLKNGSTAGRVEPADIIFIEGNFPFLLPEVAASIDIKVVYLTDDEVRLKRKWRRDIDLRKKYNENYFRNRFFREQFLMAESAYIPQMEVCDLLIDTTDATVWASTEVKARLEQD